MDQPKTFMHYFGEVFLAFSIVLCVALVWGRVYPDSPTDPALTALQEAKYTSVIFIGERKGICNPDPQYAQTLLDLNAIPTIARKDSFNEICFFGDRFIAKDIVGHLEVGNIYCGPLARTQPPFKNCRIMTDSELP
jgi:hypothetical protein